MKESDNIYFIYVGNAYPHKNLKVAIKAAAELKVMFYIVSSRNVFTKRLEKIIKKYNAEKFVNLLGFVEDKKLNDLYKNSVGFIFPSLMEGFGLPGLEAMNNGSLLIASNIPVFREIYEDHAIYFDPKDVESLKTSLQLALSLNKVQRSKIIKDNQKFVQKYSWVKMAKETLKVYEDLVS